MTTLVDRLLAVLRRAAEAGAACPTDLDLRAELGCSGEGLAGAFRLLEVRRTITVERFARIKVVTIVADGAATLRPADPKSHWRRRAARPIEHEIQTAFVTSADDAAVLVDELRRAAALPARAKMAGRRTLLTNAVRLIERLESRVSAMETA